MGACRICRDLWHCTENCPGLPAFQARLQACYENSQGPRQEHYNPSPYGNQPQISPENIIDITKLLGTLAQHVKALGEKVSSMETTMAQKVSSMEATMAHEVSSIRTAMAEEVSTLQITMTHNDYQQRETISNLQSQVNQLSQALSESKSAEKESNREMENIAHRPVPPVTATRREVPVISPPRGETNRDPAACFSISTATSPPRGARHVLSLEEYFLAVKEEWNDYEEWSKDVDGVLPSKISPRPARMVMTEEEYFWTHEEEWSDDEKEYFGRGYTPETITPAVPDPLEAAYDEFVNLNSFPLISPQPVIPLPEALKDTQKVESDTGLFETFSGCTTTTPLVPLADSTPRNKEILKVLGMIKKKPKGKHKKESYVQKENFSMLDTGQDKYTGPKMLGKQFRKMASAFMDMNGGPAIRNCTSMGEKPNREYTKRHPPDMDPRSSVALSNPS